MSGLRTLVVGFGAIASGLDRDKKMARYFEHASHASVLNIHPKFDWIGVVDPRTEAITDARDNWNVPVAETDISIAIEKADPEVVVLSAPPGQRSEAIASMPNLKAVLVEKPLSGPNDEDGAKLAAICAERGIPVIVNYWRRADRLFQDLANGKLVDQIGAVQAAFGVYGKGLANNCSHMIDFLRMQLGEVQSVQALGPATAALDSTVPNDQNVAFAMTFNNDVIASFQHIDFKHYREVGVDIWGEKGRLSILLEGISVRYFPRSENRGLENAHEISPDKGEDIEVTVSNSLYRMYDNLAAVADNVEAPWSSLSSALKNERITDQILTSANQQGVRLNLD